MSKSINDDEESPLLSSKHISAPKIGLLGLVGLIYFNVSGGPYATEEIVQSAGPKWLIKRDFIEILLRFIPPFFSMPFQTCKFKATLFLLIFCVCLMLFFSSPLTFMIYRLGQLLGLLSSQSFGLSQKLLSLQNFLHSCHKMEVLSCGLSDLLVQWLVSWGGG